MKRILSMLLVTLMLVTSASAFAEPTVYKELGFSIDFSTIQNKSTNYPYLTNFGVCDHEPYVGYMGVVYTNLPKDTLKTIRDILNNPKDDEEYQDYADLLDNRTAYIAEILVTDTTDLEKAGIDPSELDKLEITEFATLGDYHYFFYPSPVDDLLSIYDEAEYTGDYEIPPQEMKAATIADIEMVRSELLKQLQNAELFEPVNTDAEYIDKVVEFESVDLDGNVVKSADLFKDNKITMINIWGTWCINCMNEMSQLAEIHKRMQEKGCGIVGVEYERDSMNEMADQARMALADNGVTYPNVWMPKDNPIFEKVNSYPFSLFVDSKGKILTYPINGAAVSKYEPTFEKLLAGEAVEDVPETGSTKNESGEYRVFVYDAEGNPVKGVIVQLCDESTCSFQKTKADGTAVFQVEAPKVYDVHVGKVPEGYKSSDETYKTLDTYSDVNIFIEKAE